MQSNILGRENIHCVGVIQGLGKTASMSSKFIQSILNFTLTNNLEDQSLDDPISVQIALQKTFSDLHTKLCNNKSLFPDQSGASLTLILVIDKRIYSANVGITKAMKIDASNTV